MSSTSDSNQHEYSIADQEARFAKAKADPKNERYLDIGTVYDPSYLQGKRVAVTGANRGLGLALATAVTQAGGKLVAIVRSNSDELTQLKPDELLEGIDVRNDESCANITQQIKGGTIDIVINNAGYFMKEEETLDNLDFAEELKTIDICAVGPLRITKALLPHMIKGSKIIMITSQGGSVTWRPTQNPQGHDYGHHMSKAAANMMAMLLSQELRARDISVGIFHPGFNKTGMTEKYQEIWEREGAVDASVGAKRILYEAQQLSMDTSGKFINCEDGLEIPF